MKRNLVIYHRVDFDGIFSGCIAKKYYTDKGEGVTILGWNYNDKLPEPKDLIKNFDRIIMVDISFPEEQMSTLNKSGKLIWIDHHHSSIQKANASDYSEARGLRRIGTAACELTWEYYYRNKPCPLLIQYIGTYDVWNKERFPWNTEVLPIQYALRGEYGLDFHKIFEDFKEIVDNDQVAYYFLEHGIPILSYLKTTWEGWIKAYGFPVTVAGKYKGICLLSPQSGSAPFECVLDQYDIYIVANKKGNTYNVSFYKEPNNLPDFNLADYMASISPGGGGHASACGGTLTLEQFIKLINDQEI